MTHDDAEKSGDDGTREDAQSISLEQLSQSFAQLIGQPTRRADPVDPQTSLEPTPSATYSLDDVCPTVPRSIFEAMLFVGHPRNEPLPSRLAASLIRGVSPSEVDALVVELNRTYEEHSAAYWVVAEGSGYRLSLLPEFDALRERFYGRIRCARLSQSAIDVLALVAYSQPISRGAIDELRQRPSGGVLAQLVRRQLLRIERVDEGKRRETYYHTTDRFLDLFGLDSLDDLPRSQEIDLT